MKITCLQNELLKGINIVSKAVPTRTTMPILECILIEASSDEIKLTANDMELGIETVIEGTIEEKGNLAIDAKFLFEVIRRCQSDESNVPSYVTIEGKENNEIIITCREADVEMNMVGKPWEDFSNIPAISRNEPVVMSQFTLREVIRQTSFTITEMNSNNRVMVGELFEIKGNNLKVVALDSSRISIRNIKLRESYSDKSVIVPVKTLNEISKILVGGVEDNIEIYFTENHIVFEFDKTVVVSRLIDGEFFNIDHMFSNDYDTKVTVNRKNLLSGIDFTTVCLINDTDKKPFVMDIKDNSMEILMNTQKKMKKHLDIKKEGKDLRIGFNSKYFIDALRVIDDEDVSLYMVNHRSPCFIKDDEENYIYIILPVNLQDN